MGQGPTEQGWRPGCGGTSSSAQHVAVQVRLRPETLELSGERPPFLGLDPSGPWLGLKEDTGPAAAGVWGRQGGAVEGPRGVGPSTDALTFRLHVLSAPRERQPGQWDSLCFACHRAWLGAASS